MTLQQKFQCSALQKTDIISFVLILVCLFLNYYFPTQGALQLFSKSFFFLFILPTLYIKFILQKNLADFGFAFKTSLSALFWTLGMLSLSFFLIFLLIQFYAFDQKYLIPTYLAQNFSYFIFYELVLVNFIFFTQEFFFKGFVLFSLAKNFKNWSIFLQSLLFILFTIATQKPNWQVFPMFILSLTGGIVTYKSKSMLYSYVMGLFFLIVIDAYIIYLFK